MNSFILSPKLIPDLRAFHNLVALSVPQFTGFSVDGTTVTVMLSVPPTTPIINAIEAITPPAKVVLPDLEILTSDLINLTTVTDFERNSTIQTTAGSYTTTGIQVTLEAGKWMLSYTAVISATSNNRVINTALFNNTTIIDQSECRYKVGSGGGLLGGLLGTSADQGSNGGHAILTLASPATVSLRWYTSGGTAIMQNREITAVRIG